MKLSLEYSPEKDAWNYISSLTPNPETLYGRTNIPQGMLDQASSEIKRIISLEADPKELLEKVSAQLQKEYEANHEIYANKEKRLLVLWESVSPQISHYLSNIYQRPFPFEEKNLKGYFTTLGRCPYNYSEFSIYFSLKASPSQQISTAIHELNHFMFFYYFSDLENELGEKNYQLLKESLSFFSNPEQPGYPAEKELRELYLSRKWESIDEAILEGKKLLTSAS